MSKTNGFSILAFLWISVSSLPQVQASTVTLNYVGRTYDSLIGFYDNPSQFDHYPGAHVNWTISFESGDITNNALGADWLTIGIPGVPPSASHHLGNIQTISFDDGLFVNVPESGNVSGGYVATFNAAIEFSSDAYEVKSFSLKYDLQGSSSRRITVESSSESGDAAKTMYPASPRVYTASSSVPGTNIQA